MNGSRWHAPSGQSLPQGDVNEANEKLKIAVRHWQSVHPMLATWAQENLSEGFAVFGLHEPHRARMRTTNGLERLNKEIKRRTGGHLVPQPRELLATSQRAAF